MRHHAHSTAERDLRHARLVRDAAPLQLSLLHMNQWNLVTAIWQFGLQRASRLPTLQPYSTPLALTVRVLALFEIATSIAAVLLHLRIEASGLQGLLMHISLRSRCAGHLLATNGSDMQLLLRTLHVFGR